MTYQSVGQVASASRDKKGIIHRNIIRLTAKMKYLIISLRFIRRLGFQFLVHTLDAGYDFLRYLRYSNSVRRSINERQKLESLLFFYYHKIEKALALPEIKPLFGLSYIETILNLMDAWINLTGDLNAVVFRGSYAALARYREQVGQVLVQQNPSLIQRLDKFLASYKHIVDNLNLGGTITVFEKDLQRACEFVDFEHFVYQRHSVRNFTGRHVPDNVIIQAVKLAQRSPSVCNRQCSRVHVFTSVVDKAKVLQHQNGNRGFGHLADRILLITADQRSFVSSGERHQGYIDASLFTMTLLYALQAYGVASCCLNLNISFNKDISLRRDCRISEWEIPIMMIAIGYPPESFQVATSARIPTESVLFFRELDT